ncbi:hypothetical protein BH11PSE2_BH11PSE2_08500 [soil metagenome]
MEFEPENWPNRPPGAAAGARPNFCPSCGAAATGTGAFCTQCGGSYTEPRSNPVQQYGDYGHAFGCSTCGGDGRHLKEGQVFCPECRWLKPLAPDYGLPIDAYLWALDAQAMNTLSGIAPLNAAARGLSNKFGRPWFEAAVNGIRLGPDQLPDIFGVAIAAARRVGLPRMPELYVAGDRMWDALTLGDERDAFICIGSVLTNFAAEDLLFVLAREMGHVAAGHGLWRTVSQFVSGAHGPRSIMGDGVLKLLNPTKLVESAIDVPLMAWARHAEITADRAAALAVGDPMVARRVITQWTIKSFPLYGRLNQAALERQLIEAESQQVQAAEWTMSASPFLARRLRLMNEFFGSHEYSTYRPTIHHWTIAVPKAAAQARVRAEIDAKRDAETVRLNCVACGEAMRIPRESMVGKTEVKVRCPNEKCGKILELTPAPPNRAEVKRISDAAPETVRLVCVSCEEPMRVPKASLISETGEAHVRCPNPKCGAVLTVKAKPPAPPPAPPAPTLEQTSQD